MVGSFRDAAGRIHGFLMDGVTITTFDVPDATVTGLRDQRSAARSWGFSMMLQSAHGFLTDGATFTPLDVPGATNTVACGINNAGQIVGGFRDAEVPWPWVSNRWRHVHHPRCPWRLRPGAVGINDHGQIVGYFNEDGGTHGFLATPDDRIRLRPLLRSLLAPRRCGRLTGNGLPSESLGQLPMRTGVQG